MDNLPTNLRIVTADYLRKRLLREKGQCTWCGKAVPKGRRSWCSHACVYEFKIRYRPTFIRSEVEKRDRGVCASCGVDCGEIQSLLRALRGALWGVHRQWACRCLYCIEKREIGHLAEWQADHIVPVVEGGAAIGLENYRTLCTRCHKRETAELAKRRAGKKPERANEKSLF